MSKLYAGIFVALAVTLSAPAHAWGGRSKDLPKPVKFVDVKDEFYARLSVKRSTPRRVQAVGWGRSTVTDLPKSGRGISSPHLFE